MASSSFSSRARKSSMLANLAPSFVSEAASTGSEPDRPEYKSVQWNHGDALADFGLVYLGQRLYDPVIGRFLTRDPGLRLRSATTSNPYGFAFNDPINEPDPSGLDPPSIPGMGITGSSGGSGDSDGSAAAAAALALYNLGQILLSTDADGTFHPAWDAPAKPLLGVQQPSFQQSFPQFGPSGLRRDPADPTASISSPAEMAISTPKCRDRRR